MVSWEVESPLKSSGAYRDASILWGMLRSAAAVLGTVLVLGTIASASSELGAAAPPSPPLVVAVGEAQHFGDPSGPALLEPLVGLAPTLSGDGYWLAAADGGVFAYGDASWLGSIPQVLAAGTRLAEPIVDIFATKGRGFWLVASDGGVFAYGDAPWLGSIPQVLPIGTKLAAPIVAAASTPSGNGYWLLGADGGMFTFGDANYFGSIPAVNPGGSADAVAIVPSVTGKGYVIHDRDGTAIGFGDAVAGVTSPSPTADVDGRSATHIAASVGGAVTGLANLELDPGSGIAAVALSPTGGAWVVRNAVGPTVAVWQSGGLSSNSRTSALAAASRAGARATVSHGGAADYVATWRDGTVVDAAPEGWRIAMSAIALDAAEAAPLLGGPAATAFQRDELVVGRLAAARHDIRRGDVVELFGWNDTWCS